MSKHCKWKRNKASHYTEWDTECGQWIPTGVVVISYKYCPHCGLEIEFEEKGWCPKCHVAIIPDEVKAEWLRKWETESKPHYATLCVVCSKPYGEHSGTTCPGEEKENG